MNQKAQTFVDRTQNNDPLFPQKEAPISNKVDMSIFQTLREIITKSESDMKQSLDLLNRMRPKNIDDAAH